MNYSINYLSVPALCVHRGMVSVLVGMMHVIEQDSFRKWGSSSHPVYEDMGIRWDEDMENGDVYVIGHAGETVELEQLDLFHLLRNEKLRISVYDYLGSVKKFGMHILLPTSLNDVEIHLSLSEGHEFVLQNTCCEGQDVYFPIYVRHSTVNRLSEALMRMLLDYAKSFAQISVLNIYLHGQNRQVLDKIVTDCQPRTLCVPYERMVSLYLHPIEEQVG